MLGLEKLKRGVMPRLKKRLLRKSAWLQGKIEAAKWVVRMGAKPNATFIIIPVTISGLCDHDNDLKVSLTEKMPCSNTICNIRSGKIL